jgi:hypothetical protein
MQKTCDIYLISYLIYKGIKHKSVEKQIQDGKIKIFFVYEDEELKRAKQDLVNDDIIQSFISSIIKYKLLINSEKHG